MTQKQAEIDALLAEANEHYTESEKQIKAMAKARDEGLYHAWQLGKRLNALRRLVGKQDWKLCLQTKFKKPAIDVKWAEFCMEIDSENPDAKRLRNLRVTTIRSFASRRCVPQKPPIDGDIDLPPAPQFYQHLKLVNAPIS